MMVAMSVMMVAREMIPGVAMRGVAMTVVCERRLTECGQEEWKCKNASTHTSAPFIIS
jgi:hypothetical protein